MLDQLQDVEARYEELGMRVAEPDVVKNLDLFRKLMREHAELTPLIEAYRRYKAVGAELAEAQSLLAVPDMADMAREEVQALSGRRDALAEELRLLLLPRDPNDEKSVVLEIRPAAGGDESALFAQELLSMYQHYAAAKGWPFAILSLTETELGGIKEVVCGIDARGAYSRLKFESGVHRVQRVPVTESSGRIHTSTVTVAVLPEAEDVDVEIRQEDLRVDTYRASGAGGQHVNRTDSAVRITHLPTGVVVQCQNERSQLQNREVCMKMLRTKLLDMAVTEHDARIASDRKSQVGTGDRSERIRTYNFPQGRVSDHRINLTLYRIDAFLAGDMDEMIDALTLDAQTRALQNEQK